jgi:pimeloyl-ACP methyl ester carboxylesterase
MGRRTGTAVIAASVIGIGGIAAFGLRQRFHHDIDRAWRRLDSIDRRIASTQFGPVEYWERPIDAATGGAARRPVLVSHGIFHGCDGGMLSVEDMVTGRLVVSPSRFGYLGSALPHDASVTDQADALVDLIDHLELDTIDVIGVSAGTGAAVQLALRHPVRVGHLVISSGNWPGSPTARTPPSWARVFYTDAAMWLVRTASPSAFARLTGVPRGFPRTAADQATINEMGDSIFPVKPRRAGAIFDAYLANPDIERYRLEDLTVPTLIVHARDDPLASYQSAEAAARRIPGATLFTLESGGHLQLGQAEPVREQVAQFLQS